MITILSGSARENSNTLKVAKAVANLAKLKGEEIELFDFFDYDIPNYNQAFDHNNLSIWQQKAHDAILNSQLVFFITPEYNWMPTAEMIQFINRFSAAEFKPLWSDCIFATIGISAGIGGRLPALTLKNVIDEIISFNRSNGRTLSAIQEVHHTQNVIDGMGNLMDNDVFNTSFTEFVHDALSEANKA